MIKISTILFIILIYKIIPNYKVQCIKNNKEEFNEINTAQRSSCFDVANYLSQTLQETPPSIVGYFNLIDCLGKPDYNQDIENKAREAVESMDNIMQEVPTQFIGTLFYTCTVKEVDTLLTAMIRNGLFYATRELITRKIYGVQHLLHARDASKENVMHLAVRAESVNIIDMLWKFLSNQIRFLLDEKNYNDERPIDVSEEIRCTTCTTRLKEIYRITSQAHLSELPPPPPIPHIPELEVLQSIKQKSKNEKNNSNQEKSENKKKNRNKNVRKAERNLTSDMNEGYPPLSSEEIDTNLYNKGYIDLNGVIANEKKKIFDNNMIITITGFIVFMILIICCVCLIKK